MDPKSLIKNLENWAKDATSGYRDVNVTNMSSSFRDGLAFCAIIHHFRPDIIDFDSLSKENIFENNSLAFHTAERQLGVPALLDAEDMVKFSHPDRLSIITYLSQLHNCFENQNKVKNLRASFRRPNNHVPGPPAKVQAVQPKILTNKRHEVCHTCKNRVFILERLIVDSKLYHTACFRCSKCNALLNPGAYVESDTPGLYECAVCLPEENSAGTDSPESDSSLAISPGLQKKTPAKSVSPLLARNFTAKSPLSDSVSNARSSFLQNSLASKSPETKRISSPFLRGDDAASGASDATDVCVSVKDKILAYNRNSKTEAFFKSADLVNNSSPKSPSPSSDSVSLDVSPRTTTHSSSSINLDTTLKSQEIGAQPISAAETTSPAAIPSSFSTGALSSRTPTPSNKTSDSLTSPTLLGKKVPTLTSPQSSRYLSQSSGDNLESPNKLPQFAEYKSPFKSRDIFQTKFQPLKLSLATSPSPKVEEKSTSSDNSKIGAIEVPQIRPTYAQTLPRPGSAVLPSPLPRDHEATGSSSSALPSSWTKTARRRSSLESARPSKDVGENGGASSVKRLSASGLPDEKPSVSEIQSASLSPAAKLRGNIFRIDRQDVPMPSIRRSLEVKRTLSHDRPAGIGSVIGQPAETESNIGGLAEIGSDIGGPAKIEPDIGRPAKIESDIGDVKKDETAPSNEIPPCPAMKKSEPSNVDMPAPAALTIPPTKQPTPKPEKEYPDDLNPFGDDEEEYPDDLNPFGDDDDTPQPSKVKTTTDAYDESKNPFASDDDDGPPPAAPPPRPPPPQVSPYQQKSPFSSTASPSGSMRGTLKKRLAPKPPRMSEIFPTDSLDSEADTSMKTSPALSRRSLQTPSPKLRKSKPAPPPPPGGTPRQQSDTAASSKLMKEADNLKIKSTAELDSQKQSKKKKRPAPPVPIPKRKDNKKIPLKEILKEMKEIEEKQRECERQGRDIELLIRDRDKDEEPTIEEEEYIMELFELVNQKNALFRRQAELMYIKRSQRLEEQQADIETQIRQLLEKPEAEKSDDDRAKEEELILELKDIVDQRSSIIDSIEMDRRRELEEDASVQEQIEIKNGDLPITAEIKEKSSDKKKKKEKKEKKKKKHEGENGEAKKSSSKRRGLFKLS